jgi:hypothetical protein
VAETPAPDPQPEPGAGGRIPARVRPEEVLAGYRAAASVMRSAVNHVSELDSCDLNLPDGRGVVRIVTVSEVEDWINGLARRIAGGETL